MIWRLKVSNLLEKILELKSEEVSTWIGSTLSYNLSVVNSPMLHNLKSHKSTISLLLIAVDAMALLTAAVIAYNFRFRSTLFEPELQPSIATFDYELILGIVIFGWLLTFSFSGIYRLNHDSLFILNLQSVIKRSLVYFFSLGYLS